MTIKAHRDDMANATIEISCDTEYYDKVFGNIAKETSKNMSISGFRKGKVPMKLVKQKYAKELEGDADNKIILEAFEKGLKDMGLNKKDVISQPSFSSYDKKDDNSIIATMKIALTPIFVVGDYKTFLPEITTQKISDKDIEDRLLAMAHEKTPMENIEDRAVQNDDYANIDFKGYIDGELFEGGKSSGHLLHIGSKKFIGNFEDQLIGASIGDTKEVHVTFPEDYNKKDLQGKKVKFDVKINSIQIKAKPEITNEVVNDLFPDDENITVDAARKKVQKELETTKYQDHFFNDLKPKFMKTLLEKHNFPLPSLIVEKELEMLLNDKISGLSEEDLAKLKDNKEEQDKLKEKHKEEAEERVKATFIINEIAKKERIEIDDNSVMQRVYLQALYAGENPDEYIKRYEEANMLPGVKMMLVEESVINSLFTKKLEEGK